MLLNVHRSHLQLIRDGYKYSKVMFDFLLTPSLPQPAKFRVERCRNAPANTADCIASALLRSATHRSVTHNRLPMCDRPTNTREYSSVLAPVRENTDKALAPRSDACRKLWCSKDDQAQATNL